MDKSRIDQLRRYISVALLSAKIYVDMGGDAFGVNILSALFKWPDAIFDMLDMIEGKENSEDALIKDISHIMLDPLTALGLAHLDKANLPQDEKDAYRTILSRRTQNNVGEIIKHRDMIVNILVKLLGKEKQDAHRNSGNVKEGRG